MPLDLTELLRPEHTAVLTMECQRAVVGDLSPLAEIRDAAAKTGSLKAAGQLCQQARKAGAKVVHCTVEHRPDRAGSAENCRILAAAARETQAPLLAGSPAAELVPELNCQPEDIISARSHGMTPFTSTSLDQTLRNLGVRTVVACGQSLNIGIVGLVMSAVDLGYDVVVATDAVAGVPESYGEDVLEHTLYYLAQLMTSQEIVACWQD